ncbi:MAG: aminopeptidase P family protein [Lachnospiraceae bacterium]|nr:aminopeptidase P family protein [Lachnospiraceae bacterium]
MNDRLQRLYNIIKEKDLDGVILTDGYNIDYISGYKGHTGMLLVVNDTSYILTDSRYTEQASLEAKAFEIIDIGMDGYSKTVKRILEEKIEDSHTVSLGFEDKSISYTQYKALSDALGASVSLVELGDVVNKLRMIKSQDEIDLIAKAEAIGDEAFNHIINYIEVGMTEKQVALELEYVMKSLGADGLSFDTIVASGTNSSMPHAVPTDKAIEEGDFVTLDFGCIYKGYCSDMTRTVYMGDEINEKQLDIYNTVLYAQKAALKCIRPGVKCSDIDKIARDFIAEAGYGEYFGHGLGHGVGLYIHEEPRFSKSCDVILEPGMVLSVEPGIYLPGEFGVRIEDLIVVTNDGYENLANSPKVLILM